MKFKKLSSPHLNNDYAGFHPSSSSYSLERIDAGSISPKEFYARFVKTRTPCILVSQHPSSSSSFSNEFSRIFKWKDVKSYLCEKAGGAIVQVERKSEETGAFGSANRRATMTLSNYIDKLYQGDQNLYLTTQYAENNKKNNSGENEEEDALLLDHETAASVREYVQSPCSTLISDIPLRPTILGNLVPQQVNLWMGSSSSPTSSGLHHDFADNLYVLIKGSKTFTIYSPRDAEYLYTHGKIKHIFPNGLIEYHHHNGNDMGNNTPTLRQDGAHPADIAEYRLETLQRRLEQAEEVGNTKLAQRLEQEVDEAMEAMLEFGGEQGGGEMDFDSDVDDADLLRALDEDNSSDDGSIRFSNRGRNKRARLELHKEDKELSNRLDHPVSFSKIDARSLRMLDEVVEIASSSLSTGAAGEVFKKFPLLKKATQLKCEIKAGEILYLPAGWFHEVTSLGQVNSSSIDQPPIHMAFNFWHHPPTTAGTFSSPYPDNYWKDRHGKIESAMGRVYNNVVLKENRVDRSKAAAVSRRRLDRIPGKEWIVKEMQ